METVDYLFRHLAISSMLTCVRRLRRTPSSRSLLIISFMLAGIHILSRIRSFAATPILFLDVFFSPQPYLVMNSTRHPNWCQVERLLLH